MPREAQGTCREVSE